MASAVESNGQNPAATIEFEASSQRASRTGYFFKLFPVENISNGGVPWPQPGPKTQSSKAHAVRQFGNSNTCFLEESTAGLDHHLIKSHTFLKALPEHLLPGFAYKATVFC